MSYTVYWNLTERPCGVFVDCNLKVDEYTSGNVFIATVIFAVASDSGSIQVDAGHILKMYSSSSNSPQYAWPSDDCGIVLSVDDGDPNEEQVISYSCGETIINHIEVNQNFTINANAFIHGNTSFTIVMLTVTHAEHNTISSCQFFASQAVSTELTITYRYRLDGGSWVDNQVETIGLNATSSAPFIIILPFTGASVEIQITGISPLNDGSYIYRII